MIFINSECLHLASSSSLLKNISISPLDQMKHVSDHLGGLVIVQ